MEAFRFYCTAKYTLQAKQKTFDESSGWSKRMNTSLIMQMSYARCRHHTLRGESSMCSVEHKYVRAIEIESATSNEILVKKGEGVRGGILARKQQFRDHHGQKSISPDLLPSPLYACCELLFANG